MSTPKNGGWLSDGLQKARAQSAEKQARDANMAPVENPAPQVKKPCLSMRDNILAATKGIGTAGELRETLQDARECQTTPEITCRFVQLVREMDELAVYKLSLEMPEKEAREVWCSLSWNEREKRLGDWANTGDSEVRSRMDNLPGFYEYSDGRENVLLKNFLREVVDRFERPLRWVNTILGLKRFLDDLVDVEAPKSPLVKRVYNPKFVASEDAVRIQVGGEDLFYLPKPIALIARAWPYVKETEARAKAIQEKMDELKAKATPGFTPVKISRGEEGSLFLPLSGKEAGLLQSKRESNGEVTVRIKEVVGIPADQLPDEQLWDKRLCKPAGNGGKWSRFCKALEDWKTKREETDRQRRRERNDKLEPLTSVATISTRFEDQGLTQILRGENGVVALWKDNFHWGSRNKFFGIAVRHCENGTYVLEQVVSDHRFPCKGLVGTKLPLAVNADNLSVMLEQLPRMESDRYTGLKMVEKLLQARLAAEVRNAGLEEEDAENSER